MLTREEVAGAVARGYCTTANMYKELDADLVTGITNEVMALLQSLSQEAARDEALEEAAKMCDAQNTKMSRYCAHLIRAALKREPNAAGDGLAKLAALPQEMQTLAESLAGPAPAAPDVASMVKRLEGRASGLDGGIYMYEADAALMRQAAAILSRLGQIIHCAERRKDCWPCLTCGASNPLECKVHE